MIEFKMKPFNPEFVVQDWEPIRDVKFRTHMDFEFSYCDYRINGDIYTEMCPDFLDGLQKEKFWLKLAK